MGVFEDRMRSWRTLRSGLSGEKGIGGVVTLGLIGRA